MQELTNTYAFWILIFLAIAGLYLLPTLIGLIRGVDQLALAFLVNIIGGLSWVGWAGAMILAFGPRRQPQPPIAGPWDQYRR